MRRIFQIVGMFIITLFLILITNIYHDTNKKNMDNTEVTDANTRTLLIDEIHDEYFLSSQVWSSNYRYKVIVDLNDEFCVGDYVDVIYKNMIEIEPNLFEISDVTISKSDYVEPDLDGVVAYKPVIYLYPKVTTDVDVMLDLNGSFLHTYPEYLNGWHVTAYPDGTLKDKECIEYPYLFWEGKLDIQYDMSKGFCISGDKTEEFLNNILKTIGLNSKETEEFIEFWVPFMEKNPYNKICFQSTAYTDNAKLIINPKPDKLLRVYMVFQPLDHFVEIKEQTFDQFNREGFTVVEWGGSIVK
jgi:hypothetical protein